MSTVSLPPAGSGGSKISYTRKGTLPQRAIHQRTISQPTVPQPATTQPTTPPRIQPPPLILSPRSSVYSVSRFSSAPESGSSTEFDLGPVAESPVSDHAAFGSSSSLPFGNSPRPDATPIIAPDYPATLNNSVSSQDDTVPIVDAPNVPLEDTNVAARRDTDGGNVARVENPEPALEIVTFAPMDAYGMKYRRHVY